MNLKRLIAVGSAAALMLSATAIPALATWDGHQWHNDNDLDLDIDNDAWVSNYVDTTANTGFNYIGGENHHFDGVVFGLIDTGDAGAVSAVTNEVNTNIVDLCDCLGDFDDVDIDIDNDAHVRNYVDTTANTGYNAIGGFVLDGSIYTGNAGATGVVENVVNTNIVGDALP